jgi:hypothetical protein
MADAHSTIAVERIWNLKKKTRNKTGAGNGVINSLVVNLPFKGIEIGSLIAL